MRAIRAPHPEGWELIKAYWRALRGKPVELLPRCEPGWHRYLEGHCIDCGTGE